MPAQDAGRCGLMRAAAAFRLVALWLRWLAINKIGGAAASVTPAKQRRLIAAAEDFLARQVEDVPACRFDVIAIDGARIEWMRDAFGVDA